MAASRIAGTGRYLPAQVLTNEALAQRIDTSDEWIRTRTGIRQRHIAADDETTSDLATHAAREAIAAAGMKPDDDRSHHRGDGDTRHDLPVDRVHRPGQARHPQRRRGVRHRGGVLGVRVRARDRGQDGRHGRGAQRAGDRRGDLLAHPRLERPRHVRAVRRRRRRRRGRAFRQAGHPVVAPSRGCQPSRHPLRPWHGAQRRRQRHAVPAHGRHGGVQGCGEGARRLRERGAAKRRT